jgi:hypothetical protein
MSLKPHLITVPKVNSKSGILSFMEVDGTLPFDVKQLYWIYDIESEAHRGNHAHVNTDRVIVCVSGRIDIEIEGVQGETYEFALTDPSTVLFYPRLYWIKLKFHKGALAVVGASDTFKNDITVKDFVAFKKLMVSS